MFAIRVTRPRSSQPVTHLQTFAASCLQPPPHPTLSPLGEREESFRYVAHVDFGRGAGSTIVENASRWPSGLQLGLTMAAFVLTATSVNRRASPSTRSSVHRLNHREPR